MRGLSGHETAEMLDPRHKTLWLDLMVKRESKSSTRDQNKDGQFPEGKNCGSLQGSPHPSL